MTKTQMLLAAAAAVAVVLFILSKRAGAAALSPHCAGKSGDGTGYWTDVL